ncbi:MAG: signal recognition particle protein [Bacteroidales bacterium]|nr:signal recognition particle protein [Bacteroidales bacterium]MBO7142827.1 signal recognition particle protein [Bacteroidales bacterium]
MFESLSEKLEQSFKKIKGDGKLTEINVVDALKDVRRALLDADVNYDIVKDFTNKVKEKALGSEVQGQLKPNELMIKIVHDELITLMGTKETEVNLKADPAIILIAGLQGSGKTTFSGKFANFVKSKKGKKPLLVAGDVYRPAAIDQLKVLAAQIDVPVYTEEGEKNPVKIAREAIKQAKQNGNDVVIIDTAGRLAVDEEMMNEISNIKKETNPTEILFVVDSMTGQDAVNTAKAFNDRLNFDGVVLTKLDGDTRGGAALSIRYTVDKPIKFVSQGEKIDALDIFYPARMADRILGMGDIVSLAERLQAQYDAEEAAKLQQKIRKDQFNFNDFLDQIQQIKKMGSLKDLAAMIPGVGKAIKNLDISDDAFKEVESIIKSMTPYEREHPEVINGSRRRRIADGSGNDVAVVNRLLKQFEETRKMMKMLSGGGGRRLMGMMQGMGRRR